MGLLGGLAVLLAAAPVHAGQPSAGGPASDQVGQVGVVAESLGLEAAAFEVGTRRWSPVGGPPANTWAERRDFTLYGLPVRGAFETVWGEGDRARRVIAARYPEVAPQLRPQELRVDLDEARERLGSVLRPDQQADQRAEDLDGLLVYRLILGRPVLAWEFDAPLSMGSAADPRPSRSRVWISAGTGRVLEVEEQLFAINETEVFRINPQVTPEPTLVTLENLDPEAEPWAEGVVFDGQYLNGVRVRAFDCIDDDGGPFAPWYKEGECWPTQQVRADENGDFFVPLPDITLLADNIDPVDQYSELAMYYHAEKFFGVLEDKGVEGFPCEMSNMLANFHWIEPAPGYPDLDYGPLNNAYYNGQCDIAKGPTMLFGQGSSVDFAFDGDVIYHELGHGIVQHLTPEGLTAYNTREEAVLRDARALNEAIADYHAMMISERPELGDYVGFYWPDLGKPWIRNADNDRICPRDMAGQEHNDSEPFSAALWAARKRLGSKLDTVVLGALPLLAADTSHEQSAAAMLEIAAAQVEAGTWSADDYDQLERALQARGLVDCPRVVDSEAFLGLEDPPFLYLRNNSDGVTPFWPGPMQIRHRIPAGSDNVLVTFEISAKGNSAGQPVDKDLDPKLLIKRSSVSADAPISFSYTLTGQGYSSEDKDDLDEVTLVQGDWDESYSPTRLSEERRQVLIRGLEPGEVVHMTFVNPERDIAVVRQLYVASVASDELDEGSPGDGRPEDPGALDDGACACTSADNGGKHGALALGLLLLVGTHGRRRRERR